MSEGRIGMGAAFQQAAEAGSQRRADQGYFVGTRQAVKENVVNPVMGGVDKVRGWFKSAGETGKRWLQKGKDVAKATKEQLGNMKNGAVERFNSAKKAGKEAWNGGVQLMKDADAVVREANADPAVKKQLKAEFKATAGDALREARQYVSEKGKAALDGTIAAGERVVRYTSKKGKEFIAGANEHLVQPTLRAGEKCIDGISTWASETAKKTWDSKFMKFLRSNTTKAVSGLNRRRLQMQAGMADRMAGFIDPKDGFVGGAINLHEAIKDPRLKAEQLALKKRNQAADIRSKIAAIENINVTS